MPFPIKFGASGSTTIIGAATSPFAPAAANDVTINIQARGITQTAPEVFIFTADVSAAGFDVGAPSGVIRDDRIHELYYRWSCSQADTFTKVPELPAQYRDAAKGYSHFWMPTIRSPGTHTISLDVWGKVSGVWALKTASIPVTVDDPDAYFLSGSGPGKTVFMSAGGNFGNAPAGATQVTSSDISAVVSSHVLNSGSDPIPTRLMVNRGESYTYSGNAMGNDASRHVPTFHYVAGGDAGARPIVTVSGTMSYDDEFTDGNGQDKDFVMQGLDLRGSWDASTSSGGLQNGIEFFDQSPAMFVIDDCIFNGCNMGQYISGGAVGDHRHGAINDCDISNWRDYGTQAGNYEGLAVTGCRVMQHPLAESGPSNIHNPHRQGVGHKLYIYGSRMFSRNGWSAGSDPTYTAIQPCVRCNQSGLEGGEFAILGNIFEGGTSTVAFSLQGVQGLTNSVVNAVIEKNMCLGGMQSTGGFEIQSTGITIRNNLVIAADNDAFTNGDGKNFIASKNDRPATGMLAEKIKIYNNTFINLKSDSHYRGDNVANFSIFDDSGGAFSNVDIHNNVVYEPNYSSGDVSAAPLVETGMQFTPVCVGYIGEGATPSHPEEATPTHRVPYTGSGGFTPGSTLNATGGKTATVVDDMGTYVYVYNLSAAINDTDSLTETPSGGTGTCNGGSEDAGTTALYIPQTGSSVLAAATTGNIAFDDFYSNRRETIWTDDGRAAAAQGCHEPDLV